MQRALAVMPDHVRRGTFIAPVGLLPMLAIFAHPAWAKNITEAQPTSPTYDMVVRWLPEARRLRVEGTIRVPPASEPRESLRFALSNSFPKLTLEPLEPTEIVGAVQAIEVFNSEFVTAWEMKWTKQLPGGKAALFRFSYEGGEKPGDVLFVSDQGAYASGSSAVWYPEIILPKVNNPPVLGSVRYAVPEGYTLVASGEPKTAAEDRRLGFERFELDRPGAFTFGIGRYSVLRSQGAPSIVFYLLDSRKHGSEYLENARRTIDTLVEDFGPYPGRQWIMVEAPAERRFGGGSGGLIFIASSLLSEGWNTPLFAHEISHAWFSGGFLFGGGFLANEGMANYAALRVVEKLKGPAAAERFRRTGEPGYNENQNALGFLRIAAAGLDARLADPPSSAAAQQVAYGKGMLVFDMLARTVGQTTFHTFLKQYLAEQHHKHSQDFSWPIYFERLGRYAHRHMNWFYRQWFERTGAPNWKVIWKQDGGAVTGAITQAAPYYRMQLQVEVLTARNATARQQLTVDGERTLFRIPVTSPAQVINVDPHFYVLHWTEEYRDLAQLLVPYTRYNLAAAYSGAVTDLRSNLEKVAAPDLFGAAFLLHYAAAKILLREKSWREAREELESALACPSRRAEMLSGVYLALANAEKEQRNNPSYVRALRATITADAIAPVPSDLGAKARIQLNENASDDSRRP